jgi:Zinc-binding domain of primase-helicase
MSNYPPHIEALRLEASRTSIEVWAIRARLVLSWGVERVGPCPVCGGKDRFSINTKKNVWNCRGCDKGGRDAISLAMHLHSVGFVPALEMITGRSADELKTEDPAARAHRKKQMAADRATAEREAQKREQQETNYREAARKAGFEIWGRGQPWAYGGSAGEAINRSDGGANNPIGQVTAVEAYLDSRGIDCKALARDIAVLRSIEARLYVKNIGGKFHTLHEGPCMLAAIQRADGRFGAVHQTWIDLSHPKGKAMIFHPFTGVPLNSKLVRGSKKGGAIRLSTPEHPRKLIMGEGIETVLTVMAHAFDPQCAYWAGVDMGNMAGRAARDATGQIIADQPDMEDRESFVPPEWCRELIYLGEDQDPEVPEKAHKNRDALTRGLRRAMNIREGLVTAISWPDGAGDFNDMVCGGLSAEVAAHRREGKQDGSALRQTDQGCA